MGRRRKFIKGEGVKGYGDKMCVGKQLCSRTSDLGHFSPTKLSLVSSTGSRKSSQPDIYLLITNLYVKVDNFIP